MQISVQDIYNIGERYFSDKIYPSRQFILGLEHADDVINEICKRTAEHNTSYYCHPVDSFIQVLYDISDEPSEISYSSTIDDKNLPGFMINTVLVSMPLIAYHIDQGKDYYSAIDTLYQNGTMDFFAKAGRHLASEDPDMATDSLLKNFQ